MFYWHVLGMIRNRIQIRWRRLTVNQFIQAMCTNKFVEKWVDMDAIQERHTSIVWYEVNLGLDFLLFLYLIMADDFAEDATTRSECALISMQRGPYHWRGLTFIKAWIRNHMPSKVYDEIVFPSPNFNGCTVEVWEWISIFISHVIIGVITYPWWDLSLSMLVKGAPER